MSVSTTTAKISEIFSSVQGEGLYAGVRQVFVRFFECNIHCVWCDTPASIGDTARHYKEMSLDEVFARIKQLWKENNHSVSLTGGEPMLQTPFIKNLIPLLKKENMPVYLETNGIFHEELKEIVDDIDYIAMDIKMPSSAKTEPFWEEHEKFLKIAARTDVFIKAVVSGDTDREDVVHAVELVQRATPETILILQPNTYELKNGVMKKCLEFHDYALTRLPRTRLMPQMHKFMKIA